MFARAGRIGFGMWPFGIALALALALGACGGVSVPPPQPQPQPRVAERPAEPPERMVKRAGRGDGVFRIAVLAPLGGEYADIGRQIVDAATLAYYEGPREDVEIIVFDSGGSPETAGSAAADALNAGAQIIVGPLLSAELPSAAATAAQRDVVVLGLTNDPRVAGDNAFVLGLSVDQEVERMASHLREREMERIVLVGPNTDYVGVIQEQIDALARADRISPIEVRLYSPGAGMEDMQAVIRRVSNHDRRRQSLQEFEGVISARMRGSQQPARALRELADGFPDEIGGRRNPRPAITRDLALFYEQLVASERLGRDAAIDAVLARVRRMDAMPEVPFDAVFLPLAGTDLTAAASLFSYFDVSPPLARIIGTSLWEIGSPSRERELRGGWYTAAERDERAAFMAKHSSTFGDSPDPVAALAYDAVAMVLDLIDRMPNGHRHVDPELLIAGGPYRASGPQFRFGPSQVALWPVAVYEVGRTEVTMIGEPRSIEPVPVAEARPSGTVTADVRRFVDRPGEL